MLTTLIIDAATLLLLPWLLLVAAVRTRRSSRGRILVVQLGKIGDMVCTTPLVRSLRGWLPDAEISVLGLRRCAAVLRGNPCVDTFIAADDPPYEGLMGRCRLLWMLHARRFDVTLAVLPGTWNAVIGLWCSAPLRLHTRGGRMGLFGMFLHGLHTHALSYERGKRTYDHYMDIARALGAPQVPYRHEVFITEEERDAASRWLSERGIGPQEPFAVLSLSAGNRLKEWPLDRFVTVARHLIDERGLRVLFSSSDRQSTARACALLGSSRSTDAGGLELRMLSAIIARASLFVSVDTGPLYIAHALEIPLVDVIGPVDPREQPPPAGSKVALVLPGGVAPSSFVAETLRVPTADQRRAIDSISAQDVLVAVARVME